MNNVTLPPRIISYSILVFISGLSPGGKIKLIKSSSISLQSPFRFVVVLALADLSVTRYSCFRIFGSFRLHESQDVMLKITSLAKRVSIPSVLSLQKAVVSVKRQIIL